jgi:hypothetical protein
MNLLELKKQQTFRMLAAKRSMRAFQPLDSEGGRAGYFDRFSSLNPFFAFLNYSFYLGDQDKYRDLIYRCFSRLEIDGWYLNSQTLSNRFKPILEAKISDYCRESLSEFQNFGFSERLDSFVKNEYDSILLRTSNQLKIYRKRLTSEEEFKQWYEKLPHWKFFHLLKNREQLENYDRLLGGYLLDDSYHPLKPVLFGNGMSNALSKISVPYIDFDFDFLVWIEISRKQRMIAVERMPGRLDYQNIKESLSY